MILFFLLFIIKLRFILSQQQYTHKHIPCKTDRQTETKRDKEREQNGFTKSVR